MRGVVKPSQIIGDVFIPPSKSETMRALVFAAMGHGQSILKNILLSPDTYAMIDGLKSFGVKFNQSGSVVYVEGVGGKPQSPTEVIDVGNSGLALRFLMAFASFVEDEVLITGDEINKKSKTCQTTFRCL